jgi:Flp pilus assembly protein TadB
VSRLVVVSGLALWAGSVLLLSRVRWFGRPSLADRLRPYAPVAVPGRARAGVLSVASFRDAVGPLARTVGERLARAFGVSEGLDERLARIHSDVDVTGFRLRQVGWATAAFGTASLAVLAARPPAVAGLGFVLGAPLLAFLVLEQRLARASRAWQERIARELPVVAEQLAMLLAAGYSLSAALHRLATRGGGACARDLARVGRRIRQGLSEGDALREWQLLARVPGLDRLVAVLALNREASDLGRLISEEARAIRRDAQRALVEIVDRRAQQVWIPVTVATLLPGSIFLMIPFLEAIRIYGNT